MWGAGGIRKIEAFRAKGVESREHLQAGSDPGNGEERGQQDEEAKQGSRRAEIQEQKHVEAHAAGKRERELRGDRKQRGVAREDEKSSEEARPGRGGAAQEAVKAERKKKRCDEAEQAVVGSRTKHCSKGVGEEEEESSAPQTEGNVNPLQGAVKQHHAHKVGERPEKEIGLARGQAQDVGKQRRAVEQKGSVRELEVDAGRATGQDQFQAIDEIDRFLNAVELTRGKYQRCAGQKRQRERPVKIPRREAVLRAVRRLRPCPATGTQGDGGGKRQNEEQRRVVVEAEEIGVGKAGCDREPVWQPEQQGEGHRADGGKRPSGRTRKALHWRA